MTLIEKIEDWKQFPNALGSEAQVAVIIGEVTAKLKEKIPAAVKKALKILSLRGTMRDLASSSNKQPQEEDVFNMPSILSVADVGAFSCRISWAESIAVISRYLEEKKKKLPDEDYEGSRLYQLAVAAKKDQEKAQSGNAKG